MTETVQFDAERACPKCAHNDVATTYKRDSHDWGCKDHHGLRVREDGGCRLCDDEHFDRLCRRCHFAWREEVPS